MRTAASFDIRVTSATNDVSHLGSLAPIALILPFYKRFNRQSSDSAIREPPIMPGLEKCTKLLNLHFLSPLRPGRNIGIIIQIEISWSTFTAI